MERGAGRFAPSPTGPLHLGSLLTATASWLDARCRGDAWYVRIDDLDVPRNQPGAADSILRTLANHGLWWDGPVRYQRENLLAYEAALQQLALSGRLFDCRCSRRTLQPYPLYPGFCRHRTNRTGALLPGNALRFHAPDREIRFDDLLLGPQVTLAQIDIGDCVIRRRDGIIAYVLATAVDDGDPAITRVIRGRDLLGQTAAQLLLIQELALTRPDYGHLPLIVNHAGQKLSKQTFARPVDATEPIDNLRFVLRALGNPAAGIDTRSLTLMLQEAQKQWSLNHIPERDSTE